MEIAYTFTAQDITLFFREFSLDRQQARRKRGPYGRAWIARYYLLLMAVPVLVFAGVAWTGVGYDVAVIASVSSGFGWRWPLNLMWSYWQKNRLFTSPQFIGSHIVRVSLDGVSDRRPGGEWTVYWSHITDIRATKNFILFLHENEAVTPVPRHAFDSALEADLFHQKSCEYSKQGVWPPAPTAGNSLEPGDNRKRY